MIPKEILNNVDNLLNQGYGFNDYMNNIYYDFVKNVYDNYNFYDELTLSSYYNSVSEAIYENNDRLNEVDGATKVFMIMIWEIEQAPEYIKIKQELVDNMEEIQEEYLKNRLDTDMEKLETHANITKCLETILKSKNQENLKTMEKEDVR